MKRELQRLADEPFDLAVVGAGIHGAAAAWAAARRGLRTALIDKADFGAATSANSLKVIHGGLRYLQHLNFSRMRESIAARRRFLAMAPQWVVPRPFMMPTFGSGIHSSPAMRAAFLLNEFISADRNRGVAPDRHIPPSRIVSRAECLRMLPGLQRPEFTGGAVWHDGLALNIDRLNLAFVTGAAEAGAAVANYVECRDLRVVQGSVTGCTVRDRIGGAEFAIRARFMINAAGPWLDRVRPPAPAPALPWVKALNLVVTRPWVSETGVALESPSGFVDPDAVLQRGKRNFFFVPWRTGTMIGTTYTAFTGDPDSARASDGEIEEFVRQVNLMYPALALRSDDVSFAHMGILPARPGASAGAPAQADKHSEIIDHAARGGPRGLLSIKGVKYTTGLSVGETAARRAALALGHARWDAIPDDLPGGRTRIAAPDIRSRAPAGRLSDATCAHLADQYGDAAPAVLALCSREPDLCRPVVEGGPVIAAELAHAIREEAACTLADLVLRRTDLGSLAHPGRAALQSCAAIAAAELGWAPARQSAEIEAVNAIYHTPRS